MSHEVKVLEFEYILASIDNGTCDNVHLRIWLSSRSSYSWSRALFVFLGVTSKIGIDCSCETVIETKSLHWLTGLGTGNRVSEQEFLSARFWRLWALLLYEACFHAGLLYGDHVTTTWIRRIHLPCVWCLHAGGKFLSNNKSGKKYLKIFCNVALRLHHHTPPNVSLTSIAMLSPVPMYIYIYASPIWSSNPHHVRSSVAPSFSPLLLRPKPLPPFFYEARNTSPRREQNNLTDG